MENQDQDKNQNQEILITPDVQRYYNNLQILKKEYDEHFPNLSPYSLKLYINGLNHKIEKLEKQLADIKKTTSNLTDIINEDYTIQF